MNAILESTTGMYPQCRAIRNFAVNIERQQTRTQDGTVKAMEIAATHCETCGSFISRESREIGRRAAYDGALDSRHQPSAEGFRTKPVQITAYSVCWPRIGRKGGHGRAYDAREL